MKWSYAIATGIIEKSIMMTENIYSNKIFLMQPTSSIIKLNGYID